MTDDPLDRAAVALGGTGLLMTVFAFISGDPWGLVKLGTGAAAVTLVLGALAVTGGRLGLRTLVLSAGAGYLIAAALQLAQFGRHTNLLGGDGSTVSLFTGLGAGLVAISFAPASDRDTEEH